MSDVNTRDIAVQANTMINSHMTDCIEFRKTIQNTLAEYRNDIKTLNWRMALLLGGLTALSKVWDFFYPHIGH